MSTEIKRSYADVVKIKTSRSKLNASSHSGSSIPNTQENKAQEKQEGVQEEKKCTCNRNFECDFCEEETDRHITQTAKEKVRKILSASRRDRMGEVRMIKIENFYACQVYDAVVEELLAILEDNKLI